MKIILNIIVLISISLLTYPGFADDQNPKNSKTKINLISASHLGFTKVRQSTTGYKDSTGSVLFLDVLKKIKSLSLHNIYSLAIGFRTYASGASNDNSKFYRLSSGPLVENVFYHNWYLQFGIGLFKEKASSNENIDIYESQGILYQINWGKIIKLNPIMECSFGGFWDFYQGNLNLSFNSHTFSSSSILKIDKSKNIGLTQGVEVALRINL